ncbi:hypothetical protein G9F32_03015 [Acinetobacter sp. 194]|uniref:hypothetical protein n=1 Tax=Acinetobacter shaoyimingii TaxID=2715164 RepID=UPI0014084FC1|nr:hypothetical protein [Acinetobacter shaoyimingii]NHB57004.1 hypothetical protein [Acinetobacter shaoyimingii]
MNKHLETLIAFKYGTQRQAIEVKDTVVEIGGDLLSAFKKLCYLFLIMVMWLVGLVLVVLLPIGTWFRLKAERDYEIAVEKAKKDYLDHMTCLCQKGSEDD